MDWLKARTLADFSECTALWLEGKIGDMPILGGYSGGVNDETWRLIPLLANLNRSGQLITAHSQPGCLPYSREYGGVMHEQRAALMAFVPRASLSAVLAAVSNLNCVMPELSPPGAPSRPARYLVSRHNHRNVTHFGYVQSPRDLARNYGPAKGVGSRPGLQQSVIAALQGCYQVTFVDNVWGRNDVLWPALWRLVRS